MWIIICSCIWSKCLYKNLMHPIETFILRAWKVKEKGHLVQETLTNVLSGLSFKEYECFMMFSTCLRCFDTHLAQVLPRHLNEVRHGEVHQAVSPGQLLKPRQEPEDHRSWRDTRRNTRASPPQQTSSGDPEPERRPETRPRTASRPDGQTESV